MLHSKRARKTVSIAFWYIVLGATAVVVMLPYIWMVSTSLKGSEEIFAYPPNWRK